MSLQLYYDGHHRLDGGTRETRNTVDLDFHDHLAAGMAMKFASG
jgi:hypothetical protein